MLHNQHTRDWQTDRQKDTHSPERQRGNEGFAICPTKSEKVLGELSAQIKVEAVEVVVEVEVVVSPFPSSSKCRCLIRIGRKKKSSPIECLFAFAFGLLERKCVLQTSELRDNSSSTDTKVSTKKKKRRRRANQVNIWNS